MTSPSLEKRLDEPTTSLGKDLENEEEFFRKELLR